jgi:TatD DNase family protein
VIDSHCHLTFPEFAGSLQRVLDQAAAHDVHGCVTISTTTSDCLDALGLARLSDRVWSTAGVHPLYADRAPHRWENLALAIAHERCVAWGELGLDNHYDDPPAPLQRAVLEEQLGFIRACRDRDPRIAAKPIVLHCREAFDDLIPVLTRSGLDTSRMVFHCFTGTPDDARKALDIGAWISFTGVVTYHNAAGVRRAAALVPLDRLMVETDAPFLSPEPHRNTRPCSPWMASATARFLAELRGVPWHDFHAALRDNTARFFAVPPL